MSNEQVLKASKVSVAYDDSESRIEALDQISLSLCRSELVCVLGPSGCGKTTLILVFGGLIYPSHGEVLLDGQAIKAPSKQVGIIFQQSTLFPWLTVRGNVEFALKVRGLDRCSRSEIADQLIRLVNLDGFSNVNPSGLSGGMTQRASLARALATEPEVLLLDEPFSSLDAVSRLQMHEVLLRVWERLRMSILFVTHDVDEAVALGDRIVIMTRRPGRIAAEVNVNLPRPRVQGGVRCAGFEDVRNHIASLAQDLYKQEG